MSHERNERQAEAGQSPWILRIDEADLTAEWMDPPIR